MRILAVDPGYDRCGVAVVENDHSVLYSACIETTKAHSHEERLYSVFHALQEVIDDWKPETLALETLFFSVNKKSAIKVAEARGVVLLLAGMKRVPVLELSPQEVKLSMTGAGNANKTQVQKMVGLVLKTDVSKKIDDEVDAIALGLAATRHLRLHKLTVGLAK